MSAHRLACALENPKRWIELSDDDCDQAAAELRRQHAEIERLREALEWTLKRLDQGAFGIARDIREMATAALERKP